MSDRYTLNRNHDGHDEIHRNAREECNQDDARDEQRIDIATAQALLEHSAVRRCGHCMGVLGLSA